MNLLVVCDIKQSHVGVVVVIVAVIAALGVGESFDRLQRLNTHHSWCPSYMTNIFLPSVAYTCDTSPFHSLRITDAWLMYARPMASTVHYMQSTWRLTFNAAEG